MNDKALSEETKLFEASVIKLSREIEKAGTLWNDSKYSELSFSVSQIANESKNVILAGNRCCISVRKMEKIAS